MSLGPFSINNIRIRSEKAKVGKPAGAKPRIYGLRKAIREGGRDERG